MIGLTRIDSAQRSGMFGAKLGQMTPAGPAAPAAAPQGNPAQGQTGISPNAGPSQRFSFLFPVSQPVFVDTTGSQIAPLPPTPAPTTVVVQAPPPAEMTRTNALIIGGGVVLGVTILALVLGASKN